MPDRRALLAAGGVGVVATACGILRSAVLANRGTDPSAVRVDEHGASPRATPAANLAAFRAAIAATPAGGTLVVPADGEATYHLDTSGGLSHALAIDRPVTVVLQGKVRTTHGASGSNPPYLFRVSAPDVTFTGTGSLSGPGYVDDSNLQDDRHHAGLIYVTGDRFRFVGPTVSDVPKIGIHLWDCREAVVSTRWRGGIGNYVTGHTGLFAVRATGGGGHRIVANRFERDEQGRRLITGYFAGGLMGATTGDEVADNVADVHEKIAYLYTHRSIVRNCSVVDAMQTDVLRIMGSDNIVEGVKGKRIRGGVSVYNGVNNKVRNCVFEDVYQSGIFVSFRDGYDQGLAGTIITDNVIVASADATKLQDGICVYLGAGDTSAIIVEGNRIGASGAASWTNGIRVEAIPPFFAERPAVRDNSVSTAVNGLNVRRLAGGDVSGNRTARLRGGEALLRITS